MQEKKTRSVKKGKKKAKLSLFLDDMTVNLENTRQLTQQLSIKSFNISKIR